MLTALLGCGVWRLFEGEKGERAKIKVSPNLSTQPFFSFSVFPSFSIGL